MTGAQSILVRNVRRRQVKAGKIRFGCLGDARIQGVAHIATVLSLIAAIVVGWFSIQEAFQNSKESFYRQRDDLINAIWLDYMNTAIEYPHISEDIDARSVSNISNSDRRRYAWYAEKVTYAAEFAIYDDKLFEEWEDSLIYEIQRHKYFFHSCEFQNGDLRTYDEKVVKLVYKALASNTCVNAGVEEWKSA